MKPRFRPLIAIPLVWLGLLPLVGCQTEETMELQRKITRLTEQIEKKDNQLVAQRVTIGQLHEQLQYARGWTDEDLEKIFYPERVVIASLSGGDDYDGQPGDDGITVYLRPVDRDGDAIKVAGDIRIELYDLANPPNENLIGKYFVPVDQVHKLWYGKLATYHYTVRCPWQKGPPRHDEITIRATFQDYLTQRVMTAQTVCKIKFAP
ncbi:MAG: hypothetical protein ACE5I3_07160 [Phycisphaerae bacterium]